MERHTSQHTHGGQTTTSATNRSWSSPSVVWVPGTNSGCQVWWQTPLAAKSSRWTPKPLQLMLWCYNSLDGFRNVQSLSINLVLRNSVPFEPWWSDRISRLLKESCHHGLGMGMTSSPWLASWILPFKHVLLMFSLTLIGSSLKESI